MSKFVKDYLERLAWTVAYAVIGFAIVSSQDLDPQYFAGITVVLMAAKGMVAKKIGDPDTASIGS